MNLALRDIRHQWGRFALTTVGISLLLMIVMGMGGIYRGLIHEATLLIESVGADFWVVQRDTRGPFAEVSRVPTNLVDRVSAVPGVEEAREFIYHTVQREREGKPLRMGVLGLSWPSDQGKWLPLAAGRPLARNHFEMVADRSLDLRLGERLRIGKDTYTVVGITHGMTDSGGNGFAFFTVQDARAIQLDLPGEALRLERAARRDRVEDQDLGKVQPALLDRASSSSPEIPVLPLGQISAVMARFKAGADPRSVLAVLGSWPDVTVRTREDEKSLLLLGVVERSQRQLGLFKALLTIISTVIMALILYTLTLDKLHDIAVLKLIGASNCIILGLILEQALLLGALGYGFAYLLGQKVFPFFPRLVVLTGEDLLQLAVIVLAISVVASLLGIWRALRVSPSEALAR